MHFNCIVVIKVCAVYVHMERYNPWWFGEVDPLYEEWLDYKVKWVPRVINEISVRPFALHFLVGPRQVGKTTVLKILIYRLLAEGRDPRSIFYYSCDELRDYRELGEVLDNYLKSRRAWGVKSSFIVLDEVTFVEEWYRALKSRIDSRLFKNDVIVVSGSASLELLAGKERFPGRRGKGRDIYMYPLSFGEYVKLIGGLRLEEAVLEDIEGFERSLAANSIFSGRLSELFEKYLETGGYPIPIRELFERGRVTYVSRKAYLDWLIADWLRAGKNINLMKEVVSYLLEVMPSPVSWHSIARHTSLASPHTSREYVTTLELLMVAKIVHWASPDGKPDYRKEKKIVFTDPFITKVLSEYTGIQVEEAAVVEATVTSHLARKYPVYYWKDSTEVDVLATVDSFVAGFEVKWRHRPRRKAKPLKTRILDKQEIPVFLASLAV
ncbi:MAG: ATP-binding protein [Thermoproteales archaeon]|mgnify:CR=1 FL=1|nr:ATP-binding protein [Thermoproteales archaeon]